MAKSPKKESKASRASKLAAALRANLARRKEKLASESAPGGEEFRRRGGPLKPVSGKAAK